MIICYSLFAIVLFSLCVLLGLATRIFSVYKCQRIHTLGVDVFQSDFSIICGQGEHVMYLSIASACMVLYVAGVPIAVFLMLFNNRKHLYNVNSPKHLAFKFEFGGLYKQCA